MARFDPKDRLTRRRAKRHERRSERKQRRARVKRWEKYVAKISLTGEPSVCQGGLGFVCSEPAVIGGLCWPHFGDDLWRPRPTSSSSNSTPPANPPVATAAAPRLAPVPRHETCNLRDLLLTNNNLADDGDTTSEYDEAGAPTTEGGDVEGQYESSEVDVGAGAVDYQEDEDPVLLLAASIPLPDAAENDNLEEADEPAEQPAELEDTGSTFHLTGVNWPWPSEAAVASLVKRKADTRALLRIFPSAQGYTVLASGRLECTARARISPDTGRWEACDCSKTFGLQYDWRRHLLTIHLAGARWEDVARQKKVDAEGSGSTAAPVPRKPRAKQERRQAQPSASTSASASTSTAAPPQEVLPRKPRQKRKRQVTEDELSEDGGYDDWGQSDLERKGKKARRW